MMNVISHPSFLEHDPLNALEGRYRIERFFNAPSTSRVSVRLLDSDEFVLRTEGVLHEVHTPDYLEKLTSICDQRETFAEIATGPKTYDIAILAASITAEAAIRGDFALVRPPGHHAGREYGGGFCLLNNIAVGAHQALRENRRVCIIDFDGHHGNGTQDLFSNTENVLYCSIHQENEYPHTGEQQRHAEPLDEQRTTRRINLPVPRGSGDDILLSAIDCFLRKAVEFKADLLAVSAGFDGYYNDALLSLNYTETGFYNAGKKIAKSGMKNFAVLEGGYHHAIPECVTNYVAGINAARKPPVYAAPSSSHYMIKDIVKKRIENLDALIVS